MEGYLLALLALLRPVFFIDVPGQFLGLTLFELAAVLLSAAVTAALLIRAAVQKTVGLTGIDVLILAFSSWCLAIYLIYLETADIGEVAKLIIPLLTYTICRNVMTDRGIYEWMLWLMILGFIVPIVVSAGLIATGRSVSHVNYWTQVPRYKGVYAGAHDLAHNAAFLIMLVALYFEMKCGHSTRSEWNPWRILLCAGLVGAALVCLYGARVRTPILGLMVFGGVLLWFRNKKLLAASAIGVLVIGAVFFERLAPRFLYDVVLVASGEWSIEKVGSNRPNIWLDNMRIFVNLPLDRQLAGVGVGNRVGVDVMLNEDGLTVRNSHNDYLEVLVQTGVVGFVLFITVQVLLLRAVLRLPRNDRIPFVALFLAVSAMNFVSNSYVSRFGLAQMLYLVLAGVGLGARYDDLRRRAPAIGTEVSGGRKSTDAAWSAQRSAH